MRDIMIRFLIGSAIMGIGLVLLKLFQVYPKAGPIFGITIILIAVCIGIGHVTLGAYDIYKVEKQQKADREAARYNSKGRGW